MNVPDSSQLRALEAVLLFHSTSPWDHAKQIHWWNLTQRNEATTRILCDVVRLALGKLPSCFGDYTGRLPAALPPDMPLNHEQRNGLIELRMAGHILPEPWATL